MWAGTGKTTAEPLVHELGWAPYRIDLAVVVSKCVGETEKHLEAVLGRAEKRDAVL